jgi:hypothetical protein
MHKAALECIRYSGGVSRKHAEIDSDELDPPIIKKVAPIGSWKVDNIPAARSIFDIGVAA